MKFLYQIPKPYAKSVILLAFLDNICYKFCENTLNYKIFMRKTAQAVMLTGTEAFIPTPQLCPAGRLPYRQNAKYFSFPCIALEEMENLEYNW